ncbi:transmembrane channel-like protein 7 isoform X2 [Corticium candelabrum]|nr:transmembrane channel-like protein 7 isoform X2 [Corticium candelabrum]
MSLQDFELEQLENGIIENPSAYDSRGATPDGDRQQGSVDEDVEEMERLRQTQKSVLDFLPSCQLSTAEVSLQRRRTRKSKHRARMSPYDRKISSGSFVGVEQLDGPGDDQLHPGQQELKRKATLKKTSTKMTDKRATMKQMGDSQARQEGRLTRWKEFRYRLSVGWKHFKDRFREWKYHLTFWGGHLKQVESLFGTGVVSYFIFLRWVFLTNVLLGCLWFFFVFIPHVSISVSPQNAMTVSQADIDNCIANVNLDKSCGLHSEINSKLDCLNQAANSTEAATLKWYHYVATVFTGAPPLENTALFMGAYENTELDISGSGNYDLPLAYVIIGGLFFFISLFLIVVKMARAYQQNFVEGLSTGRKSPFFNLVFAAWDYSITDTDAAKMKHLSLKKDLEEVINTHRAEAQHRTLKEFLWIWTVRFVINFAILGLLAMAGAAIYYAAEVSLEASVEQVDLTSFNFRLIIKQLAASLTISAFNVIYPFIFERLVVYEQYTSPVTEFTLTIFRSVAVRVSGLVVLMATVLRQVACSDDVEACGRVIETGYYTFNTSIEAYVEMQVNCKLCWETYVGQEVYRVLVIDFLFDTISTIGVQSIRHLLAKKVEIVRRKLGKPEFVIAKSVLGLVYAQALIWLGTFYGPLISLVGCIQLFATFYIKKCSLVWNCRPSSRAYRASRTNIYFLFLLLLALFGCLIPVGYSMVQIQPSQTCGPFRSQRRVYSVVSKEIDKSPSWFQGVVDYIGSAAFVIPLIVSICLVAFYFYALSKAYKKSIAILNHQLLMEGRDKQYLIKAVAHQERMLNEPAGVRRIAEIRGLVTTDDDSLQGSLRRSPTSATQIHVKPQGSAN